MASQPTPARTYKILTSDQAATYQFVTSDDPATTLYCVLSPPPYIGKYDKDWSMVVHGGPDPKSTPLAQTPIVAKITRKTCWKRIFIETGSHVQSDIKTEEKAFRVKALKRTNKVRKFFCMGEKELDWKEEDEDAANATIEEGTGEEKAVVEMVHVSHRAFEFSIDGRAYRWTGTKMHSGAVLRALRLKGFAYSVKLVRVEDHKLVASFQKTFSFCGKQSGNLHFYADEKEDPVLPERLIALTAYGMIRSEKYKRDIVWKILEEIGENAGG